MLRLRTRFAATLLATAIAAPLHAQPGEGEIFRAGNFEIRIPQGFSIPIQKQEIVGNLATTYFVSVAEEGLLMIMHVPIPDAPVDTTLATRQQLLRRALDGMLSSEDFTRIGEPEERLSETRVTLRMRVKIRMDESEPLQGIADAIIPRHGPLELWLISLAGPGAAYVSKPETQRTLESFRITDGPRLTARSDTSDVFAWLEGIWNWASRACSDNPATITVTPDRKAVRLEYARSEAMPDSARLFTYRILESGAQWIRGRIETEIRKDAQGEPVVWDFVRVTADSFCWRRGDWPADGCTQPLRRCPATHSSRPMSLLDPFVALQDRRATVRG